MCLPVSHIYFNYRMNGPTHVRHLSQLLYNTQCPSYNYSWNVVAAKSICLLGTIWRDNNNIYIRCRRFDQYRRSEKINTMWILSVGIPSVLTGFSNILFNNFDQYFGFSKMTFFENTFRYTRSCLFFL